MYTVKLILDKRRQRTDKTFPIVYRIRCKGKYVDLPTGVTALAQHFDEKKQLLKTSKEVNYQIQVLRDQYQSKLLEHFGQSFETADLLQVKAYLLKAPTDELTLHGFWEEQIQQLILSGRAGGAKTYKDALGALQLIMDMNRPIQSLTYKDLIQAEVKLLSRGVKINSVGVYFRTLRAICNKAILQELAPHDWYPFRKYKIKKEKTTPRALSLEQIKAYFQLDLPKEHPLYKTWCIGRLIFLLRGINLKDLLMLRPADIKSGRIIYRRSKTKKLYSIAILPLAKSILDELHSGGDTLVGKLDGKLQKLNVSLDSVAEYIQARKVINAHLRRIGKLIGIDIDITTYVFRYTYANVAKQLGYSKDLIAEALGHEYGNSVTGIYLELFDLEVIDTMNEAIYLKVVAVNEYSGAKLPSI